MKVAAAITVVVCVLTLCDAAPVRQSNYHRYLKWLKIAGYYDRPEAEIDMLSEEEAKQEIRPALRRMKPFYGLPADDELDDKTLRNLEQPRCGRKDRDGSQLQMSTIQRLRQDRMPTNQMLSQDRMPTNQIPSQDRTPTNQMSGQDQTPSNQMPSQDRTPSNHMSSQDQMPSNQMSSQDQMPSNQMSSQDQTATQDQNQMFGFGGSQDQGQGQMPNQGQNGMFGFGGDDFSGWRLRREIKFLSGEGRPWREFPVTIGFKNYYSGLTKEEQENVAFICAKKWADASGLSFKLVWNEIPNIYIQYKYIDGEYNSIGYAYNPLPNNNPPSTDLFLDSSENWVIGNGRGSKLEAGLCHEMGHSLDLSHSQDRNSIMYSNIGGKDDGFELGPEEKEKIVELYGEPNGKSIEGDTSATTTTPKPVTTTTPQPVKTTTPKPVKTTTPKPVTTTTPKPVTTTTPKPVRTTAPKPVTTATKKPNSTEKETIVSPYSRWESRLPSSSRKRWQLRRKEFDFLFG